MNPRTSNLAALLGSASLLTIAGAMSAQAQTQTAQVGAQEVPEQVLVTGSLIHGTAAAFDILKSDQGRTVSLILTKTW